jgi:hypothetical protein
LTVTLLVLACSTAEKPPPPDLQQRTQTQERDAVRVTVGVPTAAEAAAIYGVDLAEKQVQPVWVEVRNGAAVPYWFLSSGLDPNSFSSSETAYAFRRADGNDALRQQFDRLQFRNPVAPGAVISGYVLTNLDEGVKAVQIDLVARGDAKSFTFLVLDPTFAGVTRKIDFDRLYRDDELVHANNEDELRALLERLPCCTTNKDGSENGDPLNLVVVGSRFDLASAAIRRQWHATEILSSESLWRTVAAFFEGTRYRYSPISPLYVYGRPQDAAIQKVRGSVNERNHARFWLSPIRFRGEPVWIGQISRDIGVKLTLKSPTISTHVIDPDVDETRRYLAEDLAYSQSLYRIGYVKGVGYVPRDAPRMNLVGDPWYSDGLRAVMFLGSRPHALNELEILDWERPARFRTPGRGLAAEETRDGAP